MSDKQEKSKQYAEELREYGEKLDISTNFSSRETLSRKEHKMLVEGYKDDKLHDSCEFDELDIADLTDYMLWERSNGGNFS